MVFGGWCVLASTTQGCGGSSSGAPATSCRLLQQGLHDQGKRRWRASRWSRAVKIVQRAARAARTYRPSSPAARSASGSPTARWLRRARRRTSPDCATGSAGSTARRDTPAATGGRGSTGSAGTHGHRRRRQHRLGAAPTGGGGIFGGGGHLRQRRQLRHRRHRRLDLRHGVREGRRLLQRPPRSPGERLHLQGGLRRGWRRRHEQRGRVLQRHPSGGGGARRRTSPPPASRQPPSASARTPRARPRRRAPSASSASRLTRSRPSVATASVFAAAPVGDVASRASRRAVDVGAVPALGVADVVELHVVVLAPEERRLRERRAAAEHVEGRDAPHALRDGPVLDAHALARLAVRVARDVAGREDARRAGLRGARRRRRRDRSSSPAASASPSAGRTPMPTTTRSASSRPPPESVTARRLDRRRRSRPRWKRTPCSSWTPRRNAPTSGPSTRASGYGVGRDDVDLDAARAQRRRRLEADEARADDDRALRRPWRAR